MTSERVYNKNFVSRNKEKSQKTDFGVSQKAHPNLCVVACRERVRQRKADGAEKEIRLSNAAEQEEQPNTLEVLQFGDTLEKRFVFEGRTGVPTGVHQDDNSSLRRLHLHLLSTLGHLDFPPGLLPPISRIQLASAPPDSKCKFCLGSTGFWRATTTLHLVEIVKKRKKSSLLNLAQCVLQEHEKVTLLPSPWGMWWTVPMLSSQRKVDGLLWKRRTNGRTCTPRSMCIKPCIMRSSRTLPPRPQTMWSLLIEICQRMEDVRHTLATRAGPQRVLERNRDNLYSF